MSSLLYYDLIRPLNKLFKALLVLVDVELGVSRNGTDGVLLSVAAKRLRTVSILASATVAQRLHHGINVRFKDFAEL